MSQFRLPKDDAFIMRRVAKACELGGTHTLGDVANAIKAGAAQWWCNGDGAAVTEIQDWPLVRVLNYWIVAGRLRDCLRMQPEIEQWAMAQGCTIATARGRPQWAATVRPYGWEMDSVQFRKPLEAAGLA